MKNSHPEKSILIVDDDATTRYMSRVALEKQGYGVTEVDDGHSALNAFHTNRHDIILLDVDLPDMDGFDICKKIRTSSFGKYIPIIMVTGLDDLPSINRAYEVGATDFVIKPINWTILLHRVIHIMNASETFTHLQSSRHRLQNAKNVAGIAEWEWDIQHNVMTWSEELYQLLDVPSDFLLKEHQQILSFVHPEDVRQVQEALDNLFIHYHEIGIEYRIIRRDGGVLYVQEQARAIYDEEKRPTSILGTIQDITKRKKAEEKVKYLAYYDSLTGLPNRVLFKEYLELAIARAKRKKSSFALLFLDVDNFKRINDSLGHNAGDLLLKVVSNRLLACLRRSDCVATYQDTELMKPVARLGGDEFIIMLENNISMDNVTSVTRRIIETLSQSAVIEGHEVPISVSIGIALYPEDGRDQITLLKNADTAMYHSKELGKNTFSFYDKAMNKFAYQKLKIENDLKKAIKNKEFFLLYQPKVDLFTQKIVGVEALIRWQHPELGLITPDKFVPIAEESSLIIDIGTWALQVASQQVYEWHRIGLGTLQVAINLAARQFSEPHLVEVIDTILKQTKLPPAFLELEVTERMLMSDTDAVLHSLYRLKKLGIKLSVDDFGTGYSSLRYLSRFPIDAVKIDKSFVKKLPTSKEDAMITSAIIALAHGLNLSVVAEGVEDLQQLRYLREKQCDFVQGYYFSPPLSVNEMMQLLNHSLIFEKPT